MRSAARRRKCAISSSAGIPQMAVVIGILDQHFVRAYRVHAVVNSVAAAAGFSLNAVEGPGMNHGPSRPGDAGAFGRFRDDL